MKQEDFHKALKEKGFTQCGRNVFDTADQFYRKVEGTTHQIIVEHFYLATERGLMNSCEISIRCSSKIGKHSWIDAKYYGMSNEDLLKNIDIFSDRLYKSLKILGGHPESYNKYD